MSHLRNALLAGAAVVAFGGLAGFARAQTADQPSADQPSADQPSTVHVMNVQTPDGAVTQIRYTGDVAPQVVLVPVQAAPVSPSAMMQQISAVMDQQMATMMQVFQPMMMVRPFAADPFLHGPFAASPFSNGPIAVGLGPVPARQGVCMRSISVTYTGNGPAHVVQRTEGDCGPAAPAVNAPAALPERVNPAPHVRTIEAGDQHPAAVPAYSGMVIPAAWRHR